MKKLISYITDKQLTAEIVSIFSNAVNTHIKGWQSEIVHINDFLKNGIPTNVEAVATQGILRGTGHLLKEAANKNLDRYSNIKLPTLRSNGLYKRKYKITYY